MTLPLAQVADHCRTMAAREQDEPTRQLWLQLAADIDNYLHRPDDDSLFETPTTTKEMNP